MTHYFLNITLHTQPKFGNQSWNEVQHTAINARLHTAAKMLNTTVKALWSRLVSGEVVVAGGATLKAVSRS